MLGFSGCILLAFATRLPTVQRFDDWMEHVAGPHRLRLRRAAGMATLTGERLVHPAIAATTASLLIYTRPGPPRHFLLPLAAASLGGIITHHLVKFIYHRHRPEVALLRDKTEAAYPSGHTTNATAVIITSAYLLVREGLVPLTVAIPLAIVVCALTGASRVALGWHWTTDVFGGWMAGAGVAAMASWWFETLAVAMR